MESEVVTKQFLVQTLGKFHGHMAEHPESFMTNLENVIASSQKKTVCWMIGIFLATVAVAGTSISVYVMHLLSRL